MRETYSERDTGGQGEIQRKREREREREGGGGRGTFGQTDR